MYQCRPLTQQFSIIIHQFSIIIHAPLSQSDTKRLLGTGKESVKPKKDERRARGIGCIPSLKDMYCISFTEKGCGIAQKNEHSECQQQQYPVYTTGR